MWYEWPEKMFPYLFRPVFLGLNYSWTFLGLFLENPPKDTLSGHPGKPETLDSTETEEVRGSRATNL